ncbi:MAG: apolipoprotein N-acyltransferase [Actinomycetota bacterium]
MKLYLKIILVVLSAGTAALSFYGAGFLAWFSLIPYILALYWSRGLWERAAYSFFFGLLFFAGITFWFTYYTFGLWIPIIILLSLYPAVFGLTFHFITKIRWPYLQIILALAVWLAIEFFRCRTFMAFPWGMLAYSQFSYIPLLQITKVAGVYSLSGAIALFNLCAAFTILIFLKKGKAGYRFMALALAAVLVILVFGSISIYGYRQDESREDEGLNIALVQTNIPFDEKFQKDPGVLIPRPYSDKNYFRPDTELVVFAESVLWGPVYRERNAAFSRWAKRVASREDLYIMLGQIVWDRHKNYYNSVFLYSPQLEIEGRYNKIHPLPFAEYMPYPDKLGFLSFLNIAKVNITPDRSFDLIEYPGKGYIGTNICFESTLPVISRIFRNNGADILFVLTDDAGFRDSIASWHHVIFSAFRAVENNSYVVHSSNMGVSAVINPLGEIILDTELGERGVFYETVYLNGQKPVYSRIGNLFLYLYFVFSFIYLVIYFIARHAGKL